LPTVSAVASKTLICSGESVTLTASGANTYSLGTTGGNNTFVVSPVSTTVYLITGISSAGCTGISTLAINVNTFAITVSPNTSLCAGGSTILSVSGAQSYTWVPGITSQTISVTPSVTTVYSVNATDANSCTQSGTVSVTVFALPVINLSSGSGTICLGDAASISATGAATYSWNNGSNNATISVSTASAGTQTYSVMGTDLNGCAGTASIGILIDPCTGIEAISATTPIISIYPNPNNGEFFVKTNSAMNINVINDIGQIVISAPLSAGSDYKVNIGNLPNGIYFLVGEKGTGIRHKVIVSH
jgi:hypothetical protein